VSTRFDSRIGSRTKSNMFDSSDRLSYQSNEAFTRYDRRTDQSDRPVGSTILPCKRPVMLHISAGLRVLSEAAWMRNTMTVAHFGWTQHSFIVWYGIVEFNVPLDTVSLFHTSCTGYRHNMPPSPVTLTFWPWKWCPSHVWYALPLCQF